MTPEDEAALRRHLVEKVQALATGTGWAIKTARACHLPVEPGVSEAREALVRWANLLDEVTP